MKKLLALIFLCSAGMGACVASAEAHGYYGYRGGWVAPAIIGGVVGYSIARPYYYQPYYYPPQPVVIQQPPVYIQQPNPAPSNYHQETIFDANCNCYRTVLVPN
jgi:hypothetical protein